MTELSLRDIQYTYAALKKDVSEACHMGDYVRVDRLLGNISSLVCQYNWRYSDPELDEAIATVSKHVCSSAINPSVANPKRVVFYDKFGTTYVLAVQYLIALAKAGYEVLYILCDNNHGATAQQTPILEHLRPYHNITTIQIDGKKSRFEKAQEIYRLTCEFAPEKLFVHTSSYTTFNYVLPSIGKECMKYYIDLGDHNFWFGAGHVDYVLPYRQFGATIDFEKRGFRREQILLMPYYPCIVKREFAGFPVNTDGKVVLFTGGDYYKTIDKDNTYWTLLRELVARYPNLLVLYAAKNISSKEQERLNAFLAEKDYASRMVNIGFRADINEVFQHIDIFMGTCPMSGGLMPQYAAINHKPILQFYPEWLNTNNETEQVLDYNAQPSISTSDKVAFFMEAEKLINDREYRTKRGEELYNAIIKPEEFDDLLMRTIRSNETQIPLRFYAIQYDALVEWWLMIDKSGVLDGLGYCYGLLRKYHTLNRVVCKYQFRRAIRKIKRIKG